MTETSAPTIPDFRAELAAAQRWVGDLIAGVRADQYALPTPCDEFDVRALIGHLYGVADRVLAAAEGRDPVTVPPFAGPWPEDPAAAFRDRAERAAGLFAAAGPDRLAHPLEAPWGRVPTAVVVAVYVAENVAHGWDLAVSTGQPAETDPRLAAIGLQTMSRALPASGRDGSPFAEAVQPAETAGPTERLANWLGRSRA